MVTYEVSIDQERTLPVVVSEKLRWSTAPAQGRPREILSFERGEGSVYDEDRKVYDHETLTSPDLLAVSSLGQFRSHPRVQLLRDFIQGWYLSYVSAGETRSTPTSGPEPHLARDGANLANVIQYLQEEHPDRLSTIFDLMRSQVLSGFASDGTLKLLAYLTVLHAPDLPEVIGIEEPENQLHPELVPFLAEELREVSGSCQVLVTTHSPQFLREVQPRELWMLSRAADGFTRVQRASDDGRVAAMVDAGATLGSLWNERYLTMANVGGRT